MWQCPGVESTVRLFVPGFAAPAHLYRPGLSREWTALEAPGFRGTDGRLEGRLGRLLEEIARRPGRIVLAGHSMGAALSVLAAAELPHRIERLLLLSPAGLPLEKPVRASVADLARQVARGLYPLGALAHPLASAARAPRSMLRLAREVRTLDLSAEMKRVRTAGVPVSVIGCTTDTLVTPAHCRRAAELLGGRYRELVAAGGHVWMLADAARLAAELSTG